MKPESSETAFQTAKKDAPAAKEEEKEKKDDVIEKELENFQQQQIKRSDKKEEQPAAAEKSGKGSKSIADMLKDAGDKEDSDDEKKEKVLDPNS